MRISINSWLTIFVVVALYLVYSFNVFSPGLYQSFSLIDDGQTIQNNFFIKECFVVKKCEDIKSVLVEKEFGRFRPAYWIINFLIFDRVGLNPILLHQVRVYLIGTLLVFMLLVLAVKSGASFISTAIASIFFFISYSFTENIVRLGPVEPFQLLSLSVMSYFYLFGDNRKWLFIIIFYAISSLIKETSVVALFALSLTTWLFDKSNKGKVISMWILIFGFITFILTRLFVQPDSGSIAYSTNFKFDLRLIVFNIKQYFEMLLNITSPFIKVGLIAYAFVGVLARKINLFKNKHFVYWASIMLVFTGILVPWKYVLERYLLVTLFSISIVLALFLTEIQNLVIEILVRHKLKKWLVIVFNLLFLFLLLNMLSFKFSLDYPKSTNYKNWYSNFLRFEADQVSAIVNTTSSRVYVGAVDSIDNWEVLYEIPIHIKFIHNRDIEIVRTDIAPKEGYVFMRTPFVNSFNHADLISNGYIEDNRGSYEVSQIDPLKFRNSFIYRPLSTLLNPPISESKFLYTWAIYKK